MKKSHLYFIAVAFMAIRGFSQDQLFKKDNSKLLVKITEINPDEIKYKLYENPNGPTYTESRNNVSLIVYQDGRHEVINTSAPEAVRPSSAAPYGSPALSKADSLIYYKYSNNISINFLNFFNNELGLIYQKEFFKSHFNIVIPVAFGIEKPAITQSVYFNNGNYTLDKKLFDVGFGINYYPSLNTSVNYFIGPVFRYMQYNGTQHYSYYTPMPAGVYPNYTPLTQNSVLSRYTMSITNGLVFRTRSRLTATMFGSIGFKNDVVSRSIVDPNTEQTINPVNRDVTLFFWCGFNVGFNF